MARKELGFCGLPMHGLVILGNGQQQPRAQDWGSSVCRFLDGARLIHTCARPAFCRGAEDRPSSPATWLPESWCVCKYPLHHFCPQHRMVFSVFPKSAFNPKTPTALLLHSTLAILTSTHTDSHRIRKTTAFTM